MICLKRLTCYNFHCILLKSAWEQAEHEYAIGVIASEDELYAKKSALLEQYGNAELQEHWSYYEDFAGTVAKRLSGYTYQAWHCEKALLDSHVIGRRLICSTINFEGMQPLVVGNFTLDVDSTGIYFSGGRDPQSEERWGYENKIERDKIGVNKGIGNTVITSSGRIEFRNKNKKEG